MNSVVSGSGGFVTYGVGMQGFQCVFEMFFQVPFYSFFDAGLERLLHLSVALPRSLLPDPVTRM